MISLLQKEMHVEVGRRYIIDTGASGDVVLSEGSPRWASASGNKVMFIPECPAGFVRLHIHSSDDAAELSLWVRTPDITARPAQAPDTPSPGLMARAPVKVPSDPSTPLAGTWRVAIFHRTGGYIVMGDAETTDIRTASDPYFRIEDNAPSKLEVRIMNDWRSQGDIRSPSFGGWSNGAVGAVGEGLQMVYDVFDSRTRVPIRRFNGLIASLEVGQDYISVLAYDSMRQLIDFKDPFLLTGRRNVNDSTSSYNNVQGGRDYHFSNKIITLLGLTKYDRAEGGDSQYDTSLVRLSNIDTRPGFEFPGWAVGVRFKIPNGRITRIRVPFAEITRQQAVLLPVNFSMGACFNDANGNPDIAHPVFSMMTTIHPSNNKDQMFDFTVDIQTPSSDTNDLFVYVDSIVITADSDPRYRRFEMGTFGGKTAGCEYLQYDPHAGSDKIGVWESYNGIGTQPVFMRAWVTVDLPSTVIPVSAVTVADTVVFIPDAQIPSSDRLAGYLVTATYITAGEGSNTLISNLVGRAGMTLMGATPTTKLISWYNTGTVDYLTCIRELLDSTDPNGRQFGVQASTKYLQTIIIRERPQIGVSSPSCLLSVNDGTSDGLRIIKKFELSKYIESYISRPTVLSEDSNRIPMAIQSDDLLYGADSIEGRMGYPSINFITDNTLKDFSMLSITAEGAVKRIHRNNIEGKLTLAGYHPSMWSTEDDTTCGGKVLDLDAPQYSDKAQVAVRCLTMDNRDTVIDLDNIREDNRNRVNMSIDRGVDAQTYSLAILPDTVYIFIRATMTGGAVTLMQIIGDGTTMTSTVKTVTDGASPTPGKGYNHTTGYFPPSSAGYAVSTPITHIRLYNGSWVDAYTDNPYYAYGGQSVVVSVRRAR